jgi:hypothetical protein
MDEHSLSADVILEVIHGSRAYGTHHPDSDVDYKGVVLPTTPAIYFGFGHFEQKDKWADGVDRVWYDLRKFCRLALMCNPNIIEVLWVPPECIKVCTDIGHELIEMRQSFLSKRIFRSFAGYAYDQGKKLAAKVERGEQPNWKHAMHLVRLSRMANEIASNGSIIVRRPDAEELKEIRAGRWSYDKIMAHVEFLKESTHVLESSSPLPVHPNDRGVEEWVVGVIQRRLLGDDIYRNYGCVKE